MPHSITTYFGPISGPLAEVALLMEGARKAARAAFPKGAEPGATAPRAPEPDRKLFLLGIAKQLACLEIVDEREGADSA